VLCADAQQVQEHPRPEQQLRPIRAQTILEASSAHVPENAVIDQAQFAYLRQPTASHGTRELPEFTPAASQCDSSVNMATARKSQARCSKRTARGGCRSYGSQSRHVAALASVQVRFGVAA